MILIIEDNEMSVGTPVKPPTRTAEQIAAPLQLSEVARGLLTSSKSAREFLDGLLGIKALDDAVRFLAAALPKRESVWWGCVCARKILPKTLPTIQESALVSAENWVKDPSEANRRAAEKAAEIVGYGTAVGCLALGAFWSGGSLAPPHVATVTPREELTAQAISNAITFLTIIEPLTSEKRREEFILIGLDIASGKLRWGN
jgi:hypothetical protein